MEVSEFISISISENEGRATVNLNPAVDVFIVPLSGVLSNFIQRGINVNI